MALVNIDKNEQVFKSEYVYVEESKVGVAELKPKAPYVCKVFTPINRKNHVKPDKNNKFSKKTYTFDVTKCNEIFDLFVTDGQILVPQGAKVPPLE